MHYQQAPRAATLRQLLVALAALLCVAWDTSLASRQLKLDDFGSADADMLANHLARSAPYAIQSDNLNEGAMRNIILKLAVNETVAGQQEQRQLRDEEPNSITKSGSLAGIRANLNLRKLLEALEYNNLTSEVRFENNDSSLINITISNIKDSDKIDSLFLEEFLVPSETGGPGGPLGGLLDSNSNLNESAIFKDNHQQPPAQRTEEKRQLVRIGRPPNSAIDLSSITSPPIRASVEAVAENYTMRKVADEANIFALKLLHQLNAEKLGSRNLIQAPFAVYQGLALLAAGAMGDTSKELDRVLLGSQSAYENTKLVHDQDRPRLLASFSDSVRQLQLSATHHFRSPMNESLEASTSKYVGGSAEQHLIVANNLLFSPAAYEISPEFKSTLDTYYNNTAITRIEIGSTESIQKINSWIRGATGGLIPSVMHKKNTFDEFNVMALLCTSWLAQEWHDTFYRISSPLRSSIRLKGQARALNLAAGGLLEFEDDNKHSHFVDFIKSKPSEYIHHYHSHLAGMLVDIVTVPLKNSNHRLVTLTPLPSGAANSSQPMAVELGQQSASSPNGTVSSADLPDSSLLSRLITALTVNPRKALRSLWNVVGPEIITKQVLKTMQESRPKNIQASERTLDSAGGSLGLVQLSMPVIRGEADSSVSAALNHIGLVNAFGPDQANFIGINGHPFNYYKLHLSNVLSKTTFNLNEQGINYDKTIRTLESLRIFPNRWSERRKVSSDLDIENEDELGSEQRMKSNIVDQVKLNKPFMYLICDIRTKLILYTGVVRNPEQEGP